MKAYVIITGAVFGLITLTHIWRVIAEGLRAAMNPWFILSTVISIFFTGWAWRLSRSF